MYQSFNHFLFRTPLFSFDKLKKVSREKGEFTEILKNKYFQEAVFIASPELHKELLKYLEGKLTDKKESERLFDSLERYFSRMSTRCTPFGLFAGCSVGTISNNEATTVILEDSIQRHTRLDMYYLCTLSQELSKIAEIKNNLTYYPNTTIYPVGNKLRYIEYEYSKKRRRHKISAVQQSSLLKKILKIAENGVKIAELSNYLITQDIPQEDALDFINELIDSQLLVSELSPSVTGDDFLDKIITILEALPVKSNILKQLNEIKTLLNQIDANEDSTISLYEDVKEKIKEINIPFDENFIFQSDMTKGTVKASIGQEIMEDIKSAMTFLNRITVENRNGDLVNFTRAFMERYEDKEVPLMEALDPEMGIGYPVNRVSKVESPLIDNFVIPSQTVDYSTIQINHFQTLLFNKTIEALSKNKSEIEFTDEDVKDMKERWDDLPPTIACMFNILQHNQDKSKIFLSSFIGACGANLLARFSYTDKEIEHLVKDITLKEQEINKNVLFAEIAHLPDSRVGNILSRPHIRDYEILFLANSDLPQDKIIRMSDLTISIRNGTPYLHSKRLNKEIIPRLTNAHNYNNNPMPVYKFLCDMQIKNGRQGLFFNWGSLGNLFPYRPRVKYKNVILSSAYWTIKISDMKYLFKIKDDLLIEETNKWRNEKKIPKYVFLEDSDNKLFVDFEKPLSIHSFFSITKNRTTIQLSEFLFDMENVMIHDKNGNSYLNECIVAFHNKETK